jgi:uncharacterized protein (TIGR02599 family)
MLSTAVLGLIMVLLLATVGQTQKIWTRTSGRISQFQASRAAFEAMTRNLSQATLNTYYDLTFDGTTGKTKGYTRNSDLHFVSGKAAQDKFLKGATYDSLTYPGHAVFFQAPLGISTEAVTVGGRSVKKFRTLNNLMSAIGYYVKWGPDENLPPFIQSNPSLYPARYRYRLMEVTQPAESLTIFNSRSYYSASPFPLTTDWIRTAMGNLALPTTTDTNAPSGKQNSSHVLAENIVALIILPKLSDKDTAAPFLSPDYEYDSRPAKTDGTPMLRTDISDTDSKALRQFNQLPPMVKVTMVAIDEPSAVREQTFLGGTAPSPPKWMNNLFRSASKEADIATDLGNPESPASDSLISRLAPPPGGGAKQPVMNYRVYTMDVVLRGSKWTTVDK